MKLLTIMFVCLFIFSMTVHAWDGYDWEKGCYVEVDIEDECVYDYGDGEYHNVSIESIEEDEVEVYDYETGEYRTFDMD